MTLQFEKFTAVGGRYAPRISLRANASLGFSQGAIKRFSLDKGQCAIVLYYDKSARAIGLKPTNDPSEEGAIPLKVRSLKGNGGGLNLTAFIAAKSFLDYYAIPYDATRSYEAVWDEETKMIIVNLNGRET